MKRRVVLLALIAGATYWFLQPSMDTPSQEIRSRPTEAVQKTPQQIITQVRPFETVSRESRVRPRSGAPRPPDGNVIEFERVGDLAIGYGDVILGAVIEGADVPRRGLYEAPTPQLWDRRTIPYAINPDLPDPARVERAIAYFKEHTPVVFVPYQGERDAIVFEPGEPHCYSSLGRVGGLQPIKLSPKCGTPEIIHEIMHSLGFVHEQSRPDRDQYVEVLWDNIEDQYKPQFNIVPETFLGAIRGSSFDYRSAMLYAADTFARDKSKPAMRSRRADAQIAPVHEGLSEGDIQRLNRLYGGG